MSIPIRLSVATTIDCHDGASSIKQTSEYESANLNAIGHNASAHHDQDVSVVRMDSNVLRLTSHGGRGFGVNIIFAAAGYKEITVGIEDRSRELDSLLTAGAIFLHALDLLVSNSRDMTPSPAVA